MSIPSHTEILTVTSVINDVRQINMLLQGGHTAAEHSSHFQQDGTESVRLTDTWSIQQRDR